MPRSNALRPVLLAFVVAAMPVGVSVAQLQPGDVLVVDSGELRAVRPNGTPTGFEANLSGGVMGLATGPGGAVYYTSSGFGATPDSAVYRVDPVSGLSTPVATRDATDYYRGVAVEPGGTLVLSTFDGEIVRLNPATGAQTTLVPAGSGLFQPNFVAVGPGGSIYSTTAEAAGGYSLFRVDPVTGARTTVASGPGLGTPAGIAVEPDGDVIAAVILDRDPPPGQDVGRIVRIDPATGQLTTIYGTASDANILFNVYGIALEPGGTILAADQQAPTGTNNDGAVFRFDPVTGQRTLFYAGGPLEINPQFVAVFVPEPSAAALGLGAVAMALLGRRRRRAQ